MGLIKVPNEIDLKDIFIDIHCIGKNPQGEGMDSFQCNVYR